MAGSGRAILMIARLVLVMTMYSCSNGNLQLTMDRSWGTDYCGYLHCWYQDNSENGISTITDISLYDITQPDVRKQIANVKNDGFGIRINPSSVKNVTGNGSIADLNASLSVVFRSSQDCHLSSFLCELGGLNAYDQKETIGVENRAHASDQCDCGTVNSQIFTMSSQLSAIREVNSNLSTELSALRQDNSNLSTELSALRQDNSNLSTELSALRQDNSNLSTELSALKLQYSAIMLQFQNLSNQVSSILGYLTSTQTVPPTTVPDTSPSTTIITTPSVGNMCRRGMSHTSPRVQFLLWGQIPALCDAETDGGGWVIIQRRAKGDVDFYRDWQSYKTGFGTPDTDFWLGNDVIHNLTSQGYNELRVDLTYKNVSYFAHYNNFSVEDEQQNYTLTVSGYSGTAGDSLDYHNNMTFSTFDRDNDRSPSVNCSGYYHGAWWYDGCIRTNLNGIWGVYGSSGMTWYALGFMEDYMTFTEIKVRLRNI